MYRTRKMRKVVLFSLLSVLLLISVGYAAFSSRLTIKGTSKITSNWDVRITRVAKGTFTGSAEEALVGGVKVDPQCSDTGTPKLCESGLTASINVDLYEVGDSAEYDITISNKGDIDAKLDNVIIDNTNSNDAVIITTTGYSKGERLFKNGTPGSTKTIHVKVEYNPNYTGGPTSSEVNITFNYVQAEGGTIPDANTYTLTYDYQTNGGSKANETASYDEGENVDLTHRDNKQGYRFIGWNTDSSATTALATYTMPSSDSTLYAIYEILDQTNPIIDSINTKRTSSTITAVVTAHDDESGISKYEFSIDGGVTWIDNGENNIYTFTGLTNGETYNVEVRVTNGAGLDATDNTSVTTGLEVPTFVEIIGDNKTDVEITYPEGCGDTLTCTYKKNDEETVTITSDMIHDNKYTVEFTDSGTVIATVIEGPNTVSSSYTLDFTPTTASGEEEYDTSGYTTFIAPATGDYFLQVWGAQGGTISSKVGGKGGYSYGTVTLNQGDTLYIYTGGQGTTGTSGGGFNGGGNAQPNSAGGGGASDIRINSNSLYARVIVAGGGGGSGQDSCATGTTGYGGGETAGGSASQSSCGTQAGGGTQTSGGSGGLYSGTYGSAGTFGQGGNALSGSYKGGGGGGGWYGGGSGASAGWSNAGGGGSGYIYTTDTASNYPSGCLLNESYYLKNARTIAGDGSESFESPTGEQESGHTGDGYVKITYDLNVAENYRLILTPSNVTTGSMTVTATLDPEITASKYEFSIDNGQTWIDNGTNNVYNLTGLNHNTTYHIKARVTTPAGKVISSLSQKTEELTEPTFEQINAGMSDDVVITYPVDCSDSSYTCTYKKNDETIVNVTTQTVTVNYTESGTLVAAVTDGVNNVSSTFTVVVPERYVITYNCSENGGTGDTIRGAEKDTNADLTVTCSKEGYTFVGWNTDKDATTSLNTVVANEAKTLYGIYSKTINVTYTKDSRVRALSKYSDSCTVYNKNTSCSITLPDMEVTEPYYDTFDGYYIGNNKIGNSEEQYTFTESSSVTAKTTSMNMIQSWLNSSSTDFHSSTYKSNIITAEFVDNKNIPTEATASWDVSAVANSGKVMAWVIPDTTDSTKYHLYIGGDGGVYANPDSSNLFYNFTKLASVDVSKLNTSKVTRMDGMFAYCSSLITLDLSTFNTSKVINMGGDKRNNSSFNYYGMFEGCSKLEILDIRNIDTSNVTNMNSMFYNCSSLAALDVSNFDTSNVTNMQGMFYYCSDLTSLDVSHFNTSNVTDMSYMFSSCSGLTTLNLNHFDTSNVTDMDSMFSGCSGLTTLDVSNFDTSNVRDMSFMFHFCGEITALDLSNFDTSNVTDMSYMFGMNWNTSKLTTLDVSHFDTSNVTKMRYMFYNCYKLTTLDVSSFDTSNVTSMYDMFYNCSGLTTLDVSHFDTSNVTDMSYMFSTCSGLITLDLSSFNTSNVTNTSGMFYGCRRLMTIYASTLFDTTNVSSFQNMFSSCYYLVGGNGTTFDNTKMDITYARIDRDGLPGYFTDVNSPVISNIGTTSTSNSITATVTANMPIQEDTITKYEFSIDGGTYIDNGTNNIYTFTGLTSGQQYNIKVRVTGSTGNTTEREIAVQGTTSIDVPTYVEGNNKLTVIYPSGCGSTYTCTYKMNNDAEVTVTDRNVEIPITETSTIIGKVTDGTITVSSSYAYTVESIMKTWNSSSSTDFHSSTYNSKITSVEFLDTINIPNGATSWDVSRDGNGSVMAYVLDDGNSGYELYIAGNGNVKADSTSYLFYKFTKLSNVDINKLDTSRVADMSLMFSGCSSLTTLDLSNFDTSNVTSMTDMFSGCSVLTTLDLSSFDTRNVTNMDGMFSGCSKLTTLDVSSFNTGNVTNMHAMFSGCSKLTTLDISNYDTRNVTNMSYMFRVCSTLTTLDLSSFDTSNVIDMSNMFYGCSGLTTLDLSNLDTNNVTNMDYMFYDCSGLTTLDVSHFDTSNVTDMSYMFYNCSGLTTLDVSHFNTRNVTNMSYMFRICSSLTTLDLSSFDTSKVTNMSGMFYNCSGLTTLDVSQFDTSNVTSMLCMFFNCSSLTTLDLSDFNTSSVTNMSSMFSLCSNLTTIYTSNLFDTSNVLSSESMFNGCSKLVGGNGTTYTITHQNVTYARIDKAGQKGYFTEKTI